MRVSRSTSAAAASLLVWLVPLVSSISVPTGKLTPISPARPTPRAINPHAPANPAPVVEYSQEHPEPPPLDPSYVPVTYDYFNTLARHHIYYVPVRYRNFNAISNNIDYEPQQKFLGQTLGKNVAYKPYKQHVPLPYFPVRTVDWKSQYNQNNQHSQAANQYSQPNNQYSQVANQYSQPTNQYSQATNQYSQANNQVNEQYNAQPTQQKQHYEVVSTQAAPASTGTPQAAPTNPQILPQVYYTTGKGSYDVTGKGGSKSEYYSKDDWSKKSAYPKKVLDQGLTPRKFGSHKY